MMTPNRHIDKSFFKNVKRPAKQSAFLNENPLFTILSSMKLIRSIDVNQNIIILFKIKHFKLLR